MITFIVTLFFVTAMPCFELTAAQTVNIREFGKQKYEKTKLWLMDQTGATKAEALFLIKYALKKIQHAPTTFQENDRAKTILKFTGKVTLGLLISTVLIVYGYPYVRKKVRRYYKQHFKQQKYQVTISEKKHTLPIKDGFKKLFDAIKQKDDDTARATIMESFFSSDLSEVNPLIFAIKYDYQEMIHYILENTVSPYESNSVENSPALIMTEKQLNLLPENLRNDVLAEKARILTINPKIPHQI